MNKALDYNTTHRKAAPRCCVVAHREGHLWKATADATASYNVHCLSILVSEATVPPWQDFPCFMVRNRHDLLPSISWVWGSYLLLASHLESDYLWPRTGHCLRHSGYKKNRIIILLFYCWKIMTNYSPLEKPKKLGLIPPLHELKQ